MRYLRSSLRAAGVLSACVVVVLVIAVLVSQTSWFRDWLRRYAMREAAQFVDGQLLIGRIDGGLWGGVQLHDVRIDRGGATVVALETLTLEYRLFDFIREGVVVRRVELLAPRIALRREGDTWNLASLLVEQEPADPDAPRTVFRVGSIVLRDGQVTVDDPTCPAGTAGCLPARLEQIQMEGGLVSTLDALEVDLQSASLTTSEPNVAVRRASVSARMTDTDVDVSNLDVATVASVVTGSAHVADYATTPTVRATVSATPLAMEELARFVPAVGTTRLLPAIDLTAEGPLDALRIDANVTSEAGAVRAAVVADASAPSYGARGTASVENLNLALVLDDPSRQTALTATAVVDVSGSDLASLAGDVALDASQLEGMGYRVDALNAKARLDNGTANLTASARGYGAAVSTAGTVDYTRVAAGHVAVALTGGVRDVDIRRLPRSLGAPPIASDVSLDYRANGTLDQMQVAVQFRPSTVDRSRIDGGTTANVTVAGPRLDYAVAGGVRGVDLQRLGRVLEIAALDNPAYASDLAARVTVDGSGVTLASAVATATVHVTASTLGGARVPDLRIDIAANRGAADLRVVGRVEDVRPEVFAGRDDVAGLVSGNIDVAVSLPDVAAAFDPTSLDARALVTLDPSEVGGVRFDEVHLDADIADGQADVRSVRVISPALDLQASGPFSLVEQGTSRLTYDLQVKDAGALAALGGVSGVAGTARIDGVLTGWLQRLETDGTLTVDDAVYAESGSIEHLQGTYAAVLPALDVNRASGSVTATASRVDAAGTLLDAVDVKGSYADRQADVDVDVAQDDLRLGVGGLARLEDARQHITLRRLDVSGDGLAWSLAEGATPVVTHASGLVAVDDLRLASGDQRASMSGAVQLPADATPLSMDGLNVEVVALDLAAVGARFVPERNLAGRLDASLTMTGAVHDGRGAARVALRDGSVQGVPFSAFDVSADVSNGVAQIDAALRQSATSSLTAKGRVPLLAALGTAPDGYVVDDTLDLTVESTGIDLALVEGATSYVDEVEGRLQVDARVTGTLSRPAVNGSLVIADGAFRVPLVDASYSAVEAAIRVAPDQVAVETLRLRDAQGNPLEVTGRLGIVDVSLGDVALKATATEFRLIDNDLGDVRLTADLTVSGTPGAPVITGDISLPSSLVNVDRMLVALAGMDEEAIRDDVDMVYEPQALDAPSPAPEPSPSPAPSPAPPPAPVPAAQADGAEAADTAASPGVLEAATIDVRFTVPNDLVLRGDDVRVGEGGPGLGALNLTVGADLRATQTPEEPLLVTGAITTVRGYYDFQGRRFTVVRDGAIRFQGADVTNPTLAIAATRDISGVEARIDVEGTAKEPRLVLSSTPALDEADILALIVFNRPLDDLGTGEQVSLARQAGEMVGGRLTGSLATSLRDALDVDQFEIDAFAATGPSVTVGNRLGERIYVRLRQQLGGQDMSQILLEYELMRNLRLQTSMTQGGSTDRSPGQRVERSGIDLLYFFYY